MFLMMDQILYFVPHFSLWEGHKNIYICSHIGCDQIDINNHLLFDIVNILLDIKGFWGSQFTHVEGKVGSHEYSLFAWNLQILVPILFHCKYCMKIFHVWVNFVANGDYVTVPLYSPNTTSHRELSKIQRNLIIAHNYQHRWAFLISLLTRESPN